MIKSYERADETNEAPVTRARDERSSSGNPHVPRWQKDDDWTTEDRRLLAEIAVALAPSAEEIARQWSQRLGNSLPAALQGERLVEALTAVNLWLLDQLLRRLREGDLARLFRDSKRYNEDLLRLQVDADDEFQSSMEQLIDSLEIMAGVVGEQLRRLYGTDPRLPAILSAFGRLALRLAHVAASTFHERRSDALTRSLRVTSALLHASRELQAQAASANEIADRLAPIISRLIACDRTTVFLWNGSERAYTLAAAHGFSDEERVLLARMRPTRAGFPRIDLALRGEDVPSAELRGLLPPALLARFDVGALALARMIASGGRALGVVAALRREPRAFDDAETAILHGIAQNAARAIENVLLIEQLAFAEQRRREAAGSARDAERRRVARELHDSVLQDLTAVKLSLESVVRRLPGVGLEATIESVISLIAGLRRVVDDLRHPDLGGVSLRVAIGAHAEALAHRHGVHLTLELSQDVDIPDWSTRDVYRIAQEAIANAVRHGAPKNLAVRLYDEGDTTVLAVEDDGSGFDRERVAVGSGILGMRERAAALGADLEIHSAPGAGTQVRLSLRRIHPPGSETDV